MVNFGYPYNDIVICKDSTDYLHHITCIGNDIESGEKVTYLGVTLDQNLSGSSMITKIVSKCNNKIKFLYRNAKNLDKKTKMLLTSALVQCHFDYGSSMWYTGTTCLLKKKLQITQNKVIRFILGKDSTDYLVFLPGHTLAQLNFLERACCRCH